jgi:TolB protein
LIYEGITERKGAFDTRISYVKVTTEKGKNAYTLAISDADGYNEQIVLSSEQPIMSPSWSPNGRYLAYVSFENHRSIVYQQELRTGKRKKLAAFKGINSAPQWSPNGQSLALALSKDGNTEIYILSLKSKSLKRITQHSAIDTEPSWSPDGKFIVFTSDRSGKPQIYQIAVNNDTQNLAPKRLTFSKGSYNARPIYSPDGRYLAMVHREIGGKYRIAVLELATGYFLVLTRSRLDESPSFAPNSHMIIYATEIAGKGILEVVTVDGLTPPQQLKLQAGDVREPAWSPYRS